MESLFQDVSEREMRIQKELHNLLQEREQLKVIRNDLGFKITHYKHVS